jgi:hypothetical protein
VRSVRLDKFKRSAVDFDERDSHLAEDVEGLRHDAVAFQRVLERFDPVGDVGIVRTSSASASPSSYQSHSTGK